MKNSAHEMTAEHAAGMGLTAEEFARIKKHMGRVPNLAELGIFSAMWSEHCSYKSSRRWLATLPTTGDCVIHGPGENAGVMDIGDGRAAVFKIESHNHPSFIEPYQGAATGVGGILRDVFTMGARPVALLNALRFGAPEHRLTRYLLSGVVAGIGGYGNCIGIPTVGGEVDFNESYNGNILVNAMAVGIARSDAIFTSAASGAGNPVYYIGAKTGRDGIHGATMASAEFNADSESQRPTVQVGDPFAGKLLLEASLELMASDSVVAIQDMGAAGLTSSSVEMAAKGGLGMEINLDAVPVREDTMSAYEIMLSESQERMLVILKPEAAEVARGILQKWDLDCAEIGRLTDTGRLVLMKDDAIAADIPLAPLVEDAPEYDRPYDEPPAPAIHGADKIARAEHATPEGILKALRDMLASHHLASRRRIWEQYDRDVMADTVSPPGGDAALVRVHGTGRGIAVTTDCTPRYVKAHPETGAMQAVAEAARNISATGAKPLAITNNLNFGNPENPAIMGQIVAAIRGMGHAAREMSLPVVSGNVSLYNETDGIAIDPAPVIGMVGVIDDVGKAVGIAIPESARENTALFVIGQDGDCNTGWLGCSVYGDIFGDTKEAAPPPVDCAAELRHAAFLRAQIAAGRITAAHDIADGGLLVALAEMLMASDIGAATCGAEITLPESIRPESIHHDGNAAGWCFGEDQARFIAATLDPDGLTKAAAAAGVPITLIGQCGGDMLKFTGGSGILVAELREAHEGWLPALMDSH